MSGEELSDTSRPHQTDGEWMKNGVGGEGFLRVVKEDKRKNLYDDQI